MNKNRPASLLLVGAVAVSCASNEVPAEVPASHAALVSAVSILTGSVSALGVQLGESQEIVGALTQEVGKLKERVEAHENAIDELMESDCVGAECDEEAEAELCGHDQYCDSDQYCHPADELTGEGAFCRDLTSGKEAEEPLSEGGAYRCAEGFDISSTSGKCYSDKRGGRGEACFPDKGCSEKVTGLRCIKGICRAQGQEGSPCCNGNGCHQRHSRCSDGGICEKITGEGWFKEMITTAAGFCEDSNDCIKHDGEGENSECEGGFCFFNDENFDRSPGGDDSGPNLESHGHAVERLCVANGQRLGLGAMFALEYGKSKSFVSQKQFRSIFRGKYINRDDLLERKRRFEELMSPSQAKAKTQAVQE